MSARCGAKMLFPALRPQRLPSHLRVGQDAVHPHFLPLLSPGPLGQQHSPQKLVRGAVGRRLAGNSGPGCSEVPGRPCFPPRITTQRGRPLSRFPACGEGGRAWERPLQPRRRMGARAPGSRGAEERPAAARGQQRPALAALRVAHPTIREESVRGGNPTAQEPGVPTYPAKQCAAVSTQDAATRTPPHRGCPLSCSLTSQGQAPGGAALPPTMRPRASVTLTVSRRLSPHCPRKVESLS